MPLPGHDDNKVAREVKLAAQLMLDSEMKLEELQTRIDKMEKSGGPAQKLTLGGIHTSNPKNFSRQFLEEQKRKLTASTIGIVEDIERNATGKTQQNVNKLKSEWLRDIQPSEKGENKAFEYQEKKMLRMQSELWKSATSPDPTPTDVDLNIYDVVEKQPSTLSRARGLQQEYDYLLNENPEHMPKNETLEKDVPGKEDGPDIEPEEP